MLPIQLRHHVHQAKAVLCSDSGQGLLKGLPSAGAVVFDEKSGHQPEVAGGGGDGVQRLPATLSDAGFVKLGDKGGHQAIAVAGVNGLDGLGQKLASGIPGFGFTVVLDEERHGLFVVHDVGGRVFHHILAVSVGNSAQSSVCQRFGPVED